MHVFLKNQGRFALVSALFFGLTPKQLLAPFWNFFSRLYLVDDELSSFVDTFFDDSQQREVLKFYPVYLFYRTEERIQGTDLVVATVGTGMGTCARNALNLTFRHACRTVLPIEETLEGYQQKSLLFFRYFTRTIEYVHESYHNSS